ncbi:hypothetical protein AB1N83_011035, partial [Pleurotus pulmonarius]
APGQGLGATRS